MPEMQRRSFALENRLFELAKEQLLQDQRLLLVPPKVPILTKLVLPTEHYVIR